MSGDRSLEQRVADDLVADTLVRRPQHASQHQRGEPTPAASKLLVDMARERYELGSSTSGEAFALPVSGPRIVTMLRGDRVSLRSMLARAFFERYERVAPQQALADAFLTLEGYAHGCEAQPVHLRVGRDDEGDVWLDLGDSTGRVVRIAPGHWHVQSEPPVLFRRTILTAALPTPANAGDLCELWSFVPVEERDRPLLLAILVAWLHPDIPHPVLAILGEQGTGKTSATRTLVSVLDPSTVPTRKPPRDAEGWITAAAGSWVVALDNLSAVAPWLSDTLCRAVTGEGDVRRKLYTDGDLATFAFRRCLIINSINPGALRGDLADRTLPLTLRPIPGGMRRDERDLTEQWSEAHPRILGALLGLAANVAGVLPEIQLLSAPRMVDFARILAAVDQVLGTTGTYRYDEIRGGLARDSLQGDGGFVEALTACISSGGVTDTSVALLQLATPSAEGWRPPHGWPRDARTVTQLLKRHAPALRASGWSVSDDGGDNRDHTIRWCLAPPSRETGNGRSQHSRTSPDAQLHSVFRERASVASVDCGESRAADRGNNDETEFIP